MAGTLLRLGWTDPRTDMFGAHPLLGDVVDLNDGVTFTLLDGSLELEPPAREVALAGNPRTLGERATRALYRHNRQARAQLCLGPMASYSDLAANVRALVRWLDAPPAVPITLQWQPPSATSPVYLDVVGAAHGIPADEREWLRLQLEPIEIVLLVRPGLRGDRVTLSNLVSNPGFEAPSGEGRVVFGDNFANANAYTVLAGAAPSVAANVLTIPSGGEVEFGSASWGAINLWQARFQYATGLVAVFDCHYTDANNKISVQVGASGQSIEHFVGGAAHALATSAVALTNGAWYWVQITLFPSAPGSVADITVALLADAAGSPGANLATLGPAPTFDATTALTGKLALEAAGANLAIGGAFNGVNQVALFGPGAWGCTPLANTASGVTAGAWEQATANTYGGGAVTSYGAARLDLPPAGTVDAYWACDTGSPINNSTAIPIAAAGNTLAASIYARSSGLAATTTINLILQELDSGGAFLRSTTLHTATGNQAAWVQLAGSVVTGASAAYAVLLVEVIEPTAGASANGTVWLDNAQCWNETTTGQSSMPYCELRYHQSPAQLLVTGLLGDLPAPAFVAWGTYLASWAIGATLSYALGRRAQASANARLVGVSHGFYGTGLSPQSTATLDAASYGGYFPTTTVNPGWNPRAFSFPPADLLGVFHLFTRYYIAQTANLGTEVGVRMVTQQRSQAWYGLTTQADQLGAYNGPWSYPISAGSTWTPADAGQVNVPALPAGALTDLTANYLTPRPQWEDLNAGGATARCNWQLLLPVDGALLVGVVNNPSNAPFSVTNQWLWSYHDGLLLNRAGVDDGAAVTYSLETAALPAPAHAGGGAGTSSTGAINVNSGADPALTLDPTVGAAAVSIASGSAGTAAGGAGVNQLAGYVADNAGAVLPLHVELQYSPLYLYPR